MNAPKNSPWGPVQFAHQIAPGIWSVSTASHGGIKLTPALNERVPTKCRREGAWYEEDCDWAIPAMVFAREFEDHDRRQLRDPAVTRDCARRTARAWLPNFYFSMFPGPPCPVSGDQHDFDEAGAPLACCVDCGAAAVPENAEAFSEERP